MVKLIGKKINCAVFISGRGSNLKSIYNFSIKKNANIDLKLVISDNSYAKGILFAIKKNIITKIINYKNKSEAEKKVLKFLSEYNIELICLAGFMRILSRKFINKFNHKIINIHPSLLPKYKGLYTHERVIKNKEEYSGCTVHFVNDRIDTGKIILKEKIKIFKSDTPKKLEKRILRVENQLYPKAIKKILSKI